MSNIRKTRRTNKPPRNPPKQITTESTSQPTTPPKEHHDKTYYKEVMYTKKIVNGISGVFKTTIVYEGPIPSDNPHGYFREIVDLNKPCDPKHNYTEYILHTRVKEHHNKVVNEILTGIKPPYVDPLNHLYVGTPDDIKVMKEMTTRDYKPRLEMCL